MFHLQYIIPRLGPVGDQGSNTPVWNSFMTDDFFPLEYSWNWDTLKSGPKVRYSIKAIGPAAVHPTDPFNQTSMLELCDKLRTSFPQINFNWFDILRHAFHDEDSWIECENLDCKSPSQSSSSFLAFELDNAIATKAYFVPVKAEQHGIARLEVLIEAIESLRRHGPPFAGHDKLLAFSKSRQGSKLTIIGVVID